MAETGFPYDLFVIGSGPAGQRAAIQAAKLGARVGLAEQNAELGGVCINTGTIPSKTFRESVLQVSGFREQDPGGIWAPVLKNVTMPQLLHRVNHVVRNEVEVTRNQLLRNGVDLFQARASFAGSHSLQLDPGPGEPSRTVDTRAVVIATGSAASRDAHIPFDGRKVLTSDDILELQTIPRTLTVIGAGVIGCEYASMFAALGVRVTIVDRRPDLLSFLDTEIVAALIYHLRRARVRLRLGESVSGVETLDDDLSGRIRIQLESGKQLMSDAALYSVGRRGLTDGLELERVGLDADDRGRISVNEHYQTASPNIYAVGDVIGFPALAATSMEQGRLAAAHALGAGDGAMSALSPYGIYTVPEISMVGATEQELTDAGVPYEVGTAEYREIARGQILGDVQGLLKLLFHLETRELLGVHAVGEGATELVHLGQAVMSFGGGADYFVNAVFNYPTLAECYKTAAFDAINCMAELGPGGLGMAA